MDLILIAAVAEDNVIGNKGQIPWKIPEDMKRFKKLTMGHPVIMGRKTYESIPEKYRPLPGRTNVVVSRVKTFEDYPEGVIVCNSIHAAIREANQIDGSCYVAGGHQVYEQTIGLANRLEITKVHGEFEGDAFFPPISPELWREKFREDYGDYSFVTYELRG